MSSARFMRTSNSLQTPEVRQWAAALRRALVGWRGGRYVKPSLLASKANVPSYAAVPLLQLLEEDGMGKLGLVVVDDDRLPIRFFRSIPEIPAVVVDEMGATHSVDRSHIELAFDLESAK